MSRADDKIVECIRRSMRKLVKLIRYSLKLQRAHSTENDNAQPSHSDTADRPESEDHPARKYRIEAVRDFMLALSDQQLVTGLAMLVAGFGRWTEITVYSANVVVALAYFSTSVHMGTLDFLTTYLRRHGIVKGCRVFAMLCTVILLTFLLLLQLSPNWPFQYKRSNLFLICAFWNFSKGGDVLTVNAISGIYVICFLIWQHWQRITTLYSTSGLLPQGQDHWTKQKLEKHSLQWLDYKTILCKQQARKLIIMAPTWRRTLATWALIESTAFHETCNSRIWQMASTLFTNVYGAMLIIELRSQHQGTTGPFNTMGFGQIVPVFLLALLIFALVESIYGL